MSGFPEMMITQCTGEIVSGGAIVHRLLCPIHPGARGLLGADPSAELRSGRASEIAAAFAAGYARAVANLRAADLSSNWYRDNPEQHIADYLEAEATKENTDHA